MSKGKLRFSEFQKRAIILCLHYPERYYIRLRNKKYEAYDSETGEVVFLGREGANYNIKFHNYMGIRTVVEVDLKAVKEEKIS